MNCDWVQHERKPVPVQRTRRRCAARGGTAPDALPDCAEEFEATKAFHEMMSALPAPEVTPNLLTASRMQVAGGAGTRRATAWVAPFRVGPDGVAAADASRPGFGSGYFYFGLWRRFGSDVQLASGSDAGDFDARRDSRHDEGLDGVGAVHRSAAEFRPGEHQLRSRSSRRHVQGCGERSQDPGTAGVCSAQQRQLGCAAGFGRSSGEEMRRSAQARETLTYSLRYDRIRACV